MLSLNKGCKQECFLASLLVSGGCRKSCVPSSVSASLQLPPPSSCGHRSPQRVSGCPLLIRTPVLGIRTHPNPVGPRLNSLHLQRPHCQIRSRSKLDWNVPSILWTQFNPSGRPWEEGSNNVVTPREHGRQVHVVNARRAGSHHYQTRGTSLLPRSRLLLRRSGLASPLLIKAKTTSKKPKANKPASSWLMCC